ncbi:MAG: hypothetical protein ACK4E2_03605 [Pseudothermotoga sp.]
MKSRVFEKILSYVILSIIAFYIFSSPLPLWAGLLLAALTVFLTVVMNSDLGCSIVLILPLIFITNTVIAGILKTDFFESILLSFVAVALILIFTSSGMISITSLIFLGVYLSLVRPHGTVLDLLFFGVLTGIWYAGKAKTFNFKVALLYIALILLISALFSQVNVFPLKPILSAIPTVRENQRQEQSQEQIIIVRKSQRQQESQKNKLTEFIDKIWFPVILTLFGILLFTFTLGNFGIKGTLKLLILGALFFAIVVSSLSLLFRLIKPSEKGFEELSQIEQSITQNEQNLQISSNATVITVEDEGMNKSKVNFMSILDMITVVLLLVVTGTIIYSIFKTARLKAPQAEKIQEQIPEDVHIYPLDKIPEFEPTEKFILGAYWWLRRKYFSNLHHLTPLEILAVTKEQENLSIVTDSYVKLRYAHQEMTQQQMKVFYENMIRFVQNMQNQTQSGTMSDIDVEKPSDEEAYEK